MAACVLFDLDETVLDRTNSLEAFVHWQVNGMLRGQIRHSKPRNFSDSPQPIESLISFH
jgi:hypothetical protein